MITASQRERVAACPASEALPHVHGSSEPAERGQAIHAFLATAGSDRAAALAACPEDWRPICEAIDLSKLPTHLLTEAAFAYDPIAGTARYLGSNLERDYAAAGVLEHEMAGTADVVGVDPVAHRGYVGDYFTGFSEMRKDAQLEFLALCLFVAQDLDEVVTEAIQIGPDGKPWVERRVYDVLELARVAAELRRLPALVQRARTELAERGVADVHEGAWCRYCPAFAACPAKGRLAVQLARGQLVEPGRDAERFTPELAGMAWARLKAAKQVLAQVERGVRAALDEHGELPLPGGRRLVKVVASGNESLDGAIAFQVLAEQHGLDVARSAVTMEVTKAGIRNALRPVAQKHGELGRANDAALEAIRARGGASRGTKTSLEEIAAPAGEIAGD